MEPSRIKSYLRSASSLMIGRASLSGTVPPPAAASPERTGGSDPAPETSVPAPAALSPQEEEEEDTVAGSTTDDATSVSTDNDNAEDSREASRPGKHYEVTFHQWIHAESALDLKANADLTTTDKRRDTSSLPAHFVDVLLQVDAHGIGINLSAQRRTAGPEAKACSRLVVTSFRCLHANDVGPAEACQQIQVGDELVSIDGEPLDCLERLHGKMKTMRKDSFVLVRFVRRAFENSKCRKLSDPIGVSHSNEELLEGQVNLLKFDALLRSNAHAAAVMMRDLVRRNQALQEQLMANKLQQAEQNIQLDQLHALYARTQLDNFPSFSFPKSIRPFVRYPGDSDGTTSSSIAPVVKPTGTLKLHADIELAIHEERIKLRREYARQLEIEKSKIAKEYADQLRAVQQSMQKKFEMLEAGFQQTIDRYMKNACPYLHEDGNDDLKNESESGCAIRRRIQQDLLDHRAKNHIEQQRDCTACALLEQINHACEHAFANADISSTLDGMDGQRVHNIVSIIQNYDRMRLPNPEVSHNEDSSPSCTNQPKVIVQLTAEEDDPLQP